MYKRQLDLRNNGGGSDGVLVPILMLVPGLVEEGVKVYGLVGEATYSSAIINAVELVDAGGVLAGSPTSGSVNHFGSTGSFTLPNSGIRVSCSFPEDIYTVKKMLIRQDDKMCIRDSP